MNRVRGRTLNEISTAQYSFMPQKRKKKMRYKMYVLRRRVECSIENKKDVYVCFIYYSKAFDTAIYKPLI